MIISFQYSYGCICGFVLLFLGSCTALSDLKSFDELYADGIEAYWNENWEGCIQDLESALKNFRFMKEVLKNCSVKCANRIGDKSTSVTFIISKASCLEKCEKETVGRAGLFSRISTEILDEFENKRPYVFLQFAYFRAGEFAKSLAITYTYNQYNPDDEMMNRNLEYFQNHQDATEDMFVNHDMQSHIAAYDQAIEAYNGEDYENAIKIFEDALKFFFDAQLECRAMCEGEYDGGANFLATKTFHEHTVDHYRKVLECYMACPNEAVRTSKKSFIQNFLPKLYEFLHYAYFELRDIENAAKCLQSYLLFFPENKQFIERKQLFDNADDVTPRKDAQAFAQQIKLQVSMLKFIYQSFGIHDYDKDLLVVYQAEEEEVDVEESKSFQDSFDGYSSIEEKQLDIIESKDEYNEQMLEIARKKERSQDENLNDVDISHLLETPIGRSTVDSKNLIDISDSDSIKEVPTAEGPVLFNSILLANSSQMGGPLRFALDGFSTISDCRRLIDLELTGGVTGDGYRGKSNPHTEHEVFHGITVFRAAELAEKGEVPASTAQLYFDLSERVRQQVQAYFKLDRLFFDFTHLVCRTALIKDEDLSRDDKSHPIHGDNCILEGDGKCVKRSPAFTWRDYSAIMYLNSDFDGGHFVMTDSTARRVKVQVKPKCGRLVGFSAGKECLHGVKPVTRGRRCAMALWFTLDISYDEEQRKEAKKILDGLASKDEL